MPHFMDENARKAEERILALLEAGQVTEALGVARSFFARFRHAVLAEPMQYRVACEFVAGEFPDTALIAIDRYLNRYSSGPRAHALRLQRAFLLSRYLKDYAAAEEALREILAADMEPQRHEAAQAELDRIAVLLAQVSSARASDEGVCAVIRQTDAQFDLPAVGRIVARATGQAFADVTRALRCSVGMVARGLPPASGEKLARQLQTAGVPVLVVPEDKLVGLPVLATAVCGIADAEGVKFALGGDEVVGRQWDKVHLVTCGRVARREDKPVETQSLDFPLPFGFSFGLAGLASACEGTASRGLARRTVEINVIDFFLLDGKRACARRDLDGELRPIRRGCRGQQRPRPG